MPDFSQRAAGLELMDDLSLASEALRQNLDELETINTWLGGYAPIISSLNSLRPQFPANRPLRVADVGCGGGDTLRQMAQWARKRQVPVELVGIDANAFMIGYAQDKCRAWPEIGFQQLDIFSEAFARQRFDIITCSLFCHHFTDAELARMIRQLAGQTDVGFVINDLHRHPLAYYSIKWLTRLFGGSYLVQHDAPLSVARAFHRRDLESVFAAAGVPIRWLRWRWAFRWEVVA